ncbi:MAG: DegT/DnrJ/EryC1/StrS family aminotransferase [bacterium]
MTINHSNPSIDAAEVSAVSDILLSGHLATGEEVEKFEQEMSEYFDVVGSVAVSSGTAALHLALLALEVREGMEVIIPSFCCASLYHAVIYTGASPVFADCDPTTFLLTYDSIKAQITPKTGCIILPHMFGLPAAIDEILQLGIPVIEDIAQAMGAKYKGEKTGGLTDMSITSFYATKMMTTGTGGMVLSNNQKLVDKVRDLNGVDKKKDLTMRMPYVMNDLQAGIGRCQLKKLEGFVATRRELASYLNNALGSAPVILPSDLPGREHTFFRYCLQLEKDAQSVVEFLNAHDIEAGRSIFYPLHRLQASRSKNMHYLKGTDKAWQNTISLPLYPALTKEALEYEASVLRDALEHCEQCS